jgi:hypothetical protein
MSDYSLDRKIAKYLSDKHGLSAVVSDGTVTVGGFSEKVIVATRRNLDELAARIKAVLAKSGAA